MQVAYYKIYFDNQNQNRMKQTTYSKCSACNSLLKNELLKYFKLLPESQRKQFPNETPIHGKGDSLEILKPEIIPYIVFSSKCSGSGVITLLN